jgi:hypothetical protein
MSLVQFTEDRAKIEVPAFIAKIQHSLHRQPGMGQLSFRFLRHFVTPVESSSNNSLGCFD